MQSESRQTRQSTLRQPAAAYLRYDSSTVTSPVLAVLAVAARPRCRPRRVAARPACWNSPAAAPWLNVAGIGVDVLLAWPAPAAVQARVTRRGDDGARLRRGCSPSPSAARTPRCWRVGGRRRACCVQIAEACGASLSSAETGTPRSPLGTMAELSSLRARPWPWRRGNLGIDLPACRRSTLRSRKDSGGRAGLRRAPRACRNGEGLFDWWRAMTFAAICAPSISSKCRGMCLPL